MNEISKFIDCNYDQKKKWRAMYVTEDEKGLAIVCSSKSLSSLEIRSILTDIKHIISAKAVLGKYDTLYIVIPEFNPNDKLVYILLEHIVYSLSKDYGYKVNLKIRDFTSNINTRGFFSTPLGILAQGIYNEDHFAREHMFSINKNHYRRIIKKNGNEMDTSNMLSEIKTFLFRFSMPDEFKSEFAKVVTELADNASEHGHADCCVDIDITEPDYKKNKENTDEYNYYGINVVVLNFSNTCLGDDIKYKIQNHCYSESERYDMVERAYQYHKKFFSKKRYCEEDFFNITVFQEKISGRRNESKSGGTGLAELIRNLQEYAYDDYCYVLTGDKGIFFKKNMLNFSEDKWIGFNDSNNYISDLPNDSVLFRSGTFLPGTGYNFMFIFKEH